MSDIKITIGADVAGLQGELKKAQSELSKTAIAAQKTDSSLQRLGTSGGQSMFNLKEKLLSLQSSVFTEKDRGKIASYNKEIKAVETEMKTLSAVGTGGIQSLGPAFAGMAGGATKAFSVLRNIAYILPGIGIAGIAAFATDPIINYVSSLLGATDAEKKVQEERLKNIKEYNSAIDNAVKNVAKEQTEVLGLIGVLKSETETRERKLSAIKELQKIQPDIFKNLKLEGDIVTGLDSAYALYLARLQNVIQAKVIMAELDEKIARQLKLQRAIIPETTSGYKQLTEAQRDAAKSAKLLADNSQLLGLGITKKQGVNELQGLTNEIDNLAKQLFKLSGEIKLPELKVKPEKLIIDKPNRLEFFRFEETFKDIMKKGMTGTVKPDMTIIPNVKEVIVTDEQKDKVFKGIKQLLEEERIQALSDQFDEMITNLLESTVVSIADGIGSAISSLVSSGKVDLPNLFGGLMRNLGTQIQNLGKFLITSSKLMKAAKEAFKKLLANPVASLIVGAGLVVLGAILKAEASKKYSGFATGTRNFQGGMALVGERGPERVFLPNGSAVQPNNEMNAYGGNGLILQPSIYYEGTGFRIMLNRVDAQMSRNG